MRDLLLVGGGHSHALLLRRWGMKPLAGARLTLISDVLTTPYSGMLPGAVAGIYSPGEIHIDLPRLATFAGARFIYAPVTGLDAGTRTVNLAGRPDVAGDVISLNVGSVPQTLGSRPPFGVPVKPVAPFLDALERWDAEANPRFPLVIVGGGVAGSELALSLRRRFGTAAAPPITLIEAGPRLAPELAPSASRFLMQELQRRDVVVLLGSPVTGVDAEKVKTATGAVPYRGLIWATRAQPPAWVRTTALELTSDGFIAVNDHLESRSHPGIFAAGDVATVVRQPRPKSGVYAVRQAPTLERNLRSALVGRPMTPFRAQRQALKLMGLGDGRALALRGGWLWFQGRLWWRLKDAIDRRFMKKLGDLPAMVWDRPPPAEPWPEQRAWQQQAAERCRGCAAKVGGEPLRRALTAVRQMNWGDAFDPLGAWNDGDDAAALPPGTGTLWQSVDHLTELVDDPWLFARIAVNHALGDLHAMGVVPTSVQLVAQIPLAEPALQERDLTQLIAGACQQLAADRVALLGGHSAEAEPLSLGIVAQGWGERVWTKGGLTPGDRLILTKPLGSGILHAGAMRGWVAPTDWQGLLSLQVLSHAPLLALREIAAVRAATDVTGFGLLGHAWEMAQTSGHALRLSTAPPLCPGASALWQRGLRSTSHGKNEPVAARAGLAGTPIPPAWLDPQTGGGLLLAASPEDTPSLLAAIRSAGFPDATVVASVTDGPPRIVPQEEPVDV